MIIIHVYTIIWCFTQLRELIVGAGRPVKLGAGCPCERIDRIPITVPGTRLQAPLSKTTRNWRMQHYNILVWYVRYSIKHIVLNYIELLSYFIPDITSASLGPTVWIFPMFQAIYKLLQASTVDHCCSYKYTSLHCWQIWLR